MNQLFCVTTPPQSLARSKKFKFRQRCSPATAATSPAALQAAHVPAPAPLPRVGTTNRPLCLAGSAASDFFGRAEAEVGAHTQAEQK